MGHASPETVKPGNLVELWADYRIDHIASIDIPDDTTAGGFTLTVEGETTRTIDWDATALDVAEELERLDVVGRGGVIAYGGPLPSAAVKVQFTGKDVEKRPIEITATEYLTPSGTPTIGVLQAGGHSSPEGVTFTVTTPAGADTDVSAVEMGPGVFRGEYTAPAAGGIYTFEAAGTGVSESGTFTVEAV